MVSKAIIGSRAVRGNFKMRKLFMKKSVKMSKKGTGNMEYSEKAVMGVLGLAILAAIALFVLVTVMGLSIFENITEVANIETNVLAFVDNTFALVGVAGTFVGLAILLAIIVIAFVYLRRLSSSASGSEGFRG